MKTLGLALTLLLSGTVSAQAASFSYVGKGSASLTARNLPSIGKTFRLEVSATVSPPSSLDVYTSYVLFGAKNPNVLIDFGNGRGILYSSAEVVVKATGTTASFLTDMYFPIPNSANLVGTRFYVQVLVDYWSPFSTSTRLSRGGVGVIGR